ncbi:MAG: phosphoenolpyruvate carboxykinase (ATP) [Candidatus Marinimicrobia bacterium]|jgi:phosphoenolpyruvate carboxykinase (ATP)|nr:phosphoenolpyruvate carboxykinase (ATP) [Candidatus Neomarinimicrobiota bacterium]MBT4144778.1 phosphoenolpyruvate carboxykinase (ATP) [Candidatus Neomarinimicrobiota bacterium]MBT4177652.1 phosphoenolpyruvate carboxykinase (ATP) [Candidatus Neomarinimicrobiota bacterium]MBT5405764.1 phosphoenolpyruvate carboxykinase (ATP) [Candidatus Neomarinimicrobiota bacterium]MBT6736705.1 phosphoenolpyruvate carboxykinase (ATP) [Candidatus Neomarinimicrobiota bacterium]
MITSKTLGLDRLGFKNIQRIERNLPVESLIEDTIVSKDGKIGMHGAVMVDTGRYTGRSPKDKYFVKEPSSQDHLWWGKVNQEISEDIFDELYAKVVDRYNQEDDSKTYIFDGFAGADPDYTIRVRMIAKKAWQAHFVHNMFIRPEPKELENFEPDFTIINASNVFNDQFEKHGMHSETFIIFHMEKRIAIIGGTEYGGEMKKGIFSVLNYMLPLKGVLAMHCSANVDEDGKNPAIFFGLSGTGKTTLSTDPKRPLIGDDEHGWSDGGIFNFEGGCYAKVINLNSEYEPDIYNAIRHGALLENVVFDERTRKIDFADGSKTENTRVSYPLGYIENSLFAQGKRSMSAHPEKIIFLTCDAYGVLPPVSKLSPEQASYHFISGYTAKVAGTELGITEPIATFSPCFGGPFLTLHPLRYAELLRDKMKEHHVPAYLVNTGWVGASASSGAKRISLPLTRSIIHAILDGSIESSEFEEDLYFKVLIPKALQGIDPKILNPQRAWTDLDKYHKTAKMLVGKFRNNYQTYDLGDADILNAGPSIS